MIRLCPSAKINRIETDVMQRRNRGRSINGILLLDKSVGITTNMALQKVKRLFNASKAGHTGSLDPAASGLLVICLGEATKVSGYLLNSDKHYVGVCKLGERTTTADREGEVIETRTVGNLDEKQVKEVLKQFSGEIMQIPPMHSAIKRNGQPLYKLAHQGIEVEREPRKVHIYAINLLRLEGDELEIELHCSKGTYVRTLAEDIGTALGCCAYLGALRRTRAGSMSIENSITLQSLEQLAQEGMQALDVLLLPMEQALIDWPMVELTSNSAYYLGLGQAVQVPRAPESGWVRLYAADHSFLGLGQILEDGRVAPRRLVNLS